MISGLVADGLTSGTAAATLTLSAVGITSELAQGPTSALTPSSSITELAAF